MSTLVTGAGGAIGSEIVRQLISQGTKVLAQDIDADRLAPFNAVAGIDLTAGDLLSTAYQRELRERTERTDVDAVIAAHGIDGSGSLESLDDDFVRRVISVNTGTIGPLLDVTLPALRRTTGAFVVIASQAGLQAEPNNAAYCAAKFALVGWTRSLAPRLAADGVRLCAFCPGCTETPLLYAAQERFAAAQGLNAQVFIEQRRAKIPIQTFAHAGETAAAAIYLTSRSSKRPTVFAATGGEVLH